MKKLPSNGKYNLSANWKIRCIKTESKSWTCYTLLGIVKNIRFAASPVLAVIGEFYHNTFLLQQFIVNMDIAFF